MFLDKYIFNQIKVVVFWLLSINLYIASAACESMVLNEDIFVPYQSHLLNPPEGYIEYTQEDVDAMTNRTPVVAISARKAESCFGGSINDTLVGLVTGGVLPYTYQIVRQPSGGTVVLSPTAGTYTYTNNGLYPTLIDDIFYFQATDSTSPTPQVSNVASIVRITAYQANTLSRTVCPGVTGSQSIFNAVLSNGTPPYNYFIVSPPSQGSIVLDANFLNNGQYTYTPNNPFPSTDSLTFILKDAAGCFSSNNGLVKFISTLTGLGFTINNICIGSTVSGSVLGHVSGGTPPYSNYAIVSTVKQGVLTPAVNFATTGNFTYTPNANFIGASDAFLFTAKDSTGCTSAAGTVTLTIKSINATSKTITATCAGKAITNTFAASGGTPPYTFVVTSQPLQGVVSPTSSTGNFTYMANSVVLGTSDSFTYQAIDATSCASRLGTITIPIGLQIPTNTFTTCPGVTINKNLANAGTSPFTFTKLTNPTNGNVTFFNTTTGAFTYVPNPGFLGPTDSFTYSMVDAKGCASNIVTVLIIIGLTPISDTQTADICTGGSISGAVNGVGSGGTAPYIFNLVSTTQHGTLTIDPNFAQNGKYSYTSNTGFNGPSDSFGYNIIDNTGCTSNTATVTIPIGITTVNYNTQCICQNTSLSSTINGVTLGGRLPFTYSLTGSGPLHGTLSLNSSTGAYTYTPFTGYTGPSDSFSYIVTDSASCKSSVATVTIPVGFVLLPATIGPVARGNTITSSLMPYVTRGEAPFTFTIVTPVSPQGTFTPLSGFVNNGNFSYSPSLSFVGSSDSFTYKVTDNTGCISNTVQVTILVS